LWKRLLDNRGKIAGGVVGLFLALLIIVAWPILLVIFLVFVGIILGAGYDHVEKAKQWLRSSREKSQNGPRGR
jgi:uncharacterized membrane protein